MRKVVCAAIRADDGRVMVGIRHYSGDMHSQLAVRSDAEDFMHRHGDDQGFVDQRGVYMTRREAWIVAEKAGQINSRITGQEGILYSENLY